MSLTATLTAVGTTDAATSSHCLSTADGTDPTTHGTGVLADGNDSSYIYFASGGSAEWCVGEYTDVPSALSILQVQITSKQRRGVGSDPAETHKTRRVIRIGGVNYYSAYDTCAGGGGYTDKADVWTTNPATGSPWTPAAVNAAQFGLEISSDAVGAPPSGPEGVRIIPAVDYIPLPAQISPVRHLVSKELFDKMRAGQWVTLKGGLSLLRLSMFDVVDVEHLAGPHATGDGWESDTWERWPGSVRGRTIDPNTGTVELLLKGMRGRRALLWDLGYSDKSSGALEDGIAYFAKKASRSFSRASEATFTNAVGESETVAINVPAHDDYGLQILPAAGARSADEYSWSNNTDDGGRTWNAAQGYAACEVRLAAVSGAANQTVFYVYHNASNWAWTYWDGANSRWVFEIRSAGTTYRATHSTAPTAGVGCQIGVRWTGSNAENGDAAYTASIFFNRVKGTDVNFVAAMTQAVSSTFWIGTKGGAGTDPLNGSIRKIISSQEVPTDTEMMRTI